MPESRNQVYLELKSLSCRWHLGVQMMPSALKRGLSASARIRGLG